MHIINEEMVNRAIDLARPSAEAILAAEGTTWGPKWVKGFVRVIGDDTNFPFTFGQVTEWNLEWGPNRSFDQVALAKLIVADREGLNTSYVVALFPHMLEEGEFLYPGGAHRDGNSSSASGAKGRADEAIAELVLVMLNMLIQLETDRRKAAGENQI